VVSVAVGVFVLVEVCGVGRCRRVDSVLFGLGWGVIRCVGMDAGLVAEAGTGVGMTDPGCWWAGSSALAGGRSEIAGKGCRRGGRGHRCDAWRQGGVIVDSAEDQ
jgi:hypothetical protein